MNGTPRTTAWWLAVGALVAAAAAVLPRWDAVLPADVAARAGLGAAWIALWILAALGASRPVLAWAGLDGGASWGLTLGVGTLTLSLAATAAAAAHVLRPWLLLAVLAVAALGGAAVALRGRAPAPPWAGGRAAPWAVLALPAAVQIVGITAPPVFYDTLNYHLAFPQRWLAAGGWVDFPRHAYSAYPAAVDILDVWGLAAVGGWGARAIQLVMAWSAVLAAAALGARLAGRRAALWAAALFFLTPSLLQTGTLAVADPGVAAWGGAGLLALLSARDARRPGRALFLAGLLGGGAFAGKYLAGATVALPLAAAALAMGDDAPGSRLRRLAHLAAGGALAAAPWLLRNLAWTGDPIYPYLARLFGAPPAGMTIASEIAQNGAAASGALHQLLGAIAALPVRTFHPLQVGGVIGPQWLLLLLPAVLLVRGPAARPVWAAAVTGLLGWGAFVQFGRFLLPALVPLAALTGVAADRLTRPGRPRDPVAAAVAALLVTVLAWNASAVLDPLAAERIDVVAGRESAEAYRRHWISYWPAVAPVERFVPPGGRVALVGESRCYGIPRPVLVEDPYRTPLLVELAEESPDAGALLDRLRAMGVTHLLLNRVEMARIARMRGLPGYFAEASPAALSRIRTALATARRVWADGPLELLELRAPASTHAP